MPRILNFVSNAEWNLYKPEHTFPIGKENKPVFNITHIEAMKYAAWLSKKTGRRLRLPTEEELKKAEATFEADFSKHPLPEVPDVGTFGKNKDGVADLLGVAYTWCANSEDLVWARAQWESITPASASQTPAPASQTPAPASQTPARDCSVLELQARLRAEEREARERLIKIEEALNGLNKAYDVSVKLLALRTA